MLPVQILEYLTVLLFFILMYKYAEATNTTPDKSSQGIPIVTYPAQNDDNILHSKRDALKQSFAKCDTEFSWMCLKVEFIKLMENLSERDELQILPGVSVVKDPSVKVAKTADLMADVARSYPNDPDTRLNGFIMSKLSNFLQTRTIRLRLIDPTTMIEARSAMTSGTGRKGKFGKKGGLEAIIAAGLMMKGTLMAVGMGAVALMAGKALMTALMALTLSGVLGLKALAGGGGKSTTYEIVTKPIYTSSHSHSVSHDDGHSGGGHSAHYGNIGHTGGGSGYGGYARSINLNTPNVVPQHLLAPVVTR